MHTSTPSSVLFDQLIDDLLRLRSRYPALVWRISEQDGLEIEFFLEELAADCALTLQEANLPGEQPPERPRRVRLPAKALRTEDYKMIIHELKIFLQAHHHKRKSCKEHTP